MRKILFLILFPLSMAGCTTLQPVTVPKVQPKAEIMKDCDTWIVPENTKASFINALTINKQSFDICKLQNNSKKEFILEVSK